MRVRSSGQIDLQARVSALEQKFPTEENRLWNLFNTVADPYYVALVRGLDTSQALKELKASVSPPDADILLAMCDHFHTRFVVQNEKKCIIEKVLRGRCYEHTTPW
jgi:hypothetical protein